MYFVPIGDENGAESGVDAYVVCVLLRSLLEYVYEGSIMVLLAVDAVA